MSLNRPDEEQWSSLNSIGKGSAVKGNMSLASMSYRPATTLPEEGLRSGLQSSLP